MWLLDTMVISEPTKVEASSAVLTWLASQPNEQHYTSVLCLGEIRRGVERLPASAKRTRLRNWMENDLRAWFGHRLLPVDADVAGIWGELSASAAQTPPVVDALIAATALRHGLIVVTKNEKDFARLEVPFLNPWAA